MKRIPIILLVAFISALPYHEVFTQKKYKEITLEDIWASPRFYPSLVYGVQSMNDGKHYCVLESGRINEYDYATAQKTRTIVNAGELIPDDSTEAIEIDEYEFSADEKKILIATQSESIYRYSSISLFYIWNIETRKLTPLSENGRQRLAEFSPDASKVAFVRDNNIFMKDLITGNEIQITGDGKDRQIINGTTDWVYEEEFAISKGFFWSNDGAKIAFYRFDESNVKEYFLTIWGELYPEEYKYKYPKAGEDNSVVSIQVYDLNTKETKIMDVGKETDQYIPRILWTKIPDKLAILRMNRIQNKLEILVADANTGNSEVIYNEENKYYIDITDSYTFLDDKQHFLITSEQDGYNHIYLYDMNGTMVRQLTRGKWEVTEFIGVNEINGNVYYISNESSFKNNELYVVTLDGKKKKKLSADEGVHEVEFSKTFDYYIDTYSGANYPPKISLNHADGELVKILKDNKSLENAMTEYNFSKKEFLDFKTSEGVVLNAYMIKPPDFKSSEKYPVFMYFYGGPGDQRVMNKWGNFDFVWFQMMAQKGYIIFCVDNRGTGGRGEEFKKCTYLKLGNLETIDQIEAAKYLADLKYVDGERIGVFGWSFGGYLSTLCMTKGADYIKAGIAVAPVTNWRYYDNIYTERFMRTPQGNAEGYDDNSPINHVEKLKGSFLLIHGTADDNVHVQNSIDLITALVNANKQFEMFLYPNKNHGIYGGYTRLNLYTRMTEFILKNI